MIFFYHKFFSFQIQDCIHVQCIWIFWQHLNATFFSNNKHACEPLSWECKPIDHWHNMDLQVDCATCKADNSPSSQMYMTMLSITRFVKN